MAETSFSDRLTDSEKLEEDLQTELVKYGERLRDLEAKYLESLKRI
jgi:hypothetical protein